MTEPNTPTTQNSTPILQSSLAKSFSRLRPATPDQAEEMSKHEQARAERDKLLAVDALERSMGKRYSERATDLGNYQIYHAEQKNVLVRIKDFLDDLEAHVQLGHGLMFFGPVGTGKDHLLAACLYVAVRHGMTCHRVNGQDFYGSFRDAMDGKVSESDVLRPLIEPQILAISDPIPPIGEPTAWNTMQLYRLLDRRYCNTKPTWVSLNAPSPAEAEAKLSSPVFDRLRHGAEIIKCFWPSFRQR